MSKSCCEFCTNYIYNDEMEFYECLVNLDEDETYKFMTNSIFECPYYRFDDEYKIVKKQM